MATGKRYYWIKLKESFMTSETIDFLMSQPKGVGANYVVLYQMLCLKTINTGGRFEYQIGEVIIPYDIEKIQRDTKWFTIDTIRVALELYMKLGLIYTDENGVVEFDQLPKGKYTYQEFKAADGYVLDETEYPFEITDDSTVIRVSMTNKPTPVDIPQTSSSDHWAVLVALAGSATLISASGLDAEISSSIGNTFTTASLTAPILFPTILPDVSIKKKRVIVLRGTLTTSSKSDIFLIFNCWT